LILRKRLLVAVDPDDEGSVGDIGRSKGFVIPACVVHQELACSILLEHVLDFAARVRRPLTTRTRRFTQVPTGNRPHASPTRELGRYVGEVFLRGNRRTGTTFGDRRPSADPRPRPLERLDPHLQRYPPVGDTSNDFGSTMFRSST